MKYIDGVFTQHKCPFCARITVVEVSETALVAYLNGELAQNAFPDLPASEREVIISGLCPACQAKMFGNDED